LKPTLNPDLFYEQRKEQFDHLPGGILLDLAKNENAEWRWRKAAVEIMLDHKFPEANRSEISDLLREVLADRAAKSEVEDVVETAIEGPLTFVSVSNSSELVKILADSAEKLESKSDDQPSLFAGFTTKDF